jgi:acyl carrier protein
MKYETELSASEDAALGTVVSLLRDLTSDYGINIPHDPSVVLQGSLGLDSIDIAQLSFELENFYGSSVKLAEYCSRLELDAISGLSLGDIARYVASTNKSEVN